MKYPLSRIPFLTFAAVASLAILSNVGIAAPAGDPPKNTGSLAAEDLPQNLGPVRHGEPILTDVGTKRVLAWYEPDGGGCAVSAVMYNRTDVEGTSAAGLRIRLNPGQIVHFDSAYNVKSLNLRCAEDASTLSIVQDGELAAFGIEEADTTMRASASGF
jgi:hypothetical protein